MSSFTFSLPLRPKRKIEEVASNDAQAPAADAMPTMELAFRPKKKPVGIVDKHKDEDFAAGTSSTGFSPAESPSGLPPTGFAATAAAPSPAPVSAPASPKQSRKRQKRHQRDRAYQKSVKRGKKLPTDTLGTEQENLDRIRYLDGERRRMKKLVMPTKEEHEQHEQQIVRNANEVNVRRACLHGQTSRETTEAVLASLEKA